MHLRILALASCAIILPTVVLAADIETNPASASTGNPAVTKPAKQPLEKGMSAATIIELIGKPEQIKPQEAPKDLEGAAEVWVYRRTIGQRIVQVATGERQVLAYAGIGLGDSNSMKTVKELIYTLKHVTIYRVTSLLMVNGKLVVAKQTLEQSEVYD